MIPGEHITSKGALSAMPMLCVLLVMFAAVVPANRAQCRKIETAEPPVFSLLSPIRDPLSRHSQATQIERLVLMN